MQLPSHIATYNMEPLTTEKRALFFRVSHHLLLAQRCFATLEDWCAAKTLWDEESETNVRVPEKFVHIYASYLANCASQFSTRYPRDIQEWQYEQLCDSASQVQYALGMVITQLENQKTKKSDDTIKNDITHALEYLDMIETVLSNLLLSVNIPLLV